MMSYITALLVHRPGQHHFRRIRQRGVLGFALVMALLVLDLRGNRQQGVGDSETPLAASPASAERTMNRRFTLM